MISGREVGVLEHLHDVRVLAPDLLDLQILPVVESSSWLNSMKFMTPSDVTYHVWGP